jgi:hypothetical protein
MLRTECAVLVGTFKAADISPLAPSGSQIVRDGYTLLVNDGVLQILASSGDEPAIVQRAVLDVLKATLGKPMGWSGLGCNFIFDDAQAPLTVGGRLAEQLTGSVSAGELPTDHGRLRITSAAGQHQFNFHRDVQTSEDIIACLDRWSEMRAEAVALMTDTTS